MVPISCMIFIFFGWNTHLLFTNQTSIESHINGDIKNEMRRQKKTTKYKNIYQLSISNNISAVLGNNKWLWLLPFSHPQVGDGYRYPTIPLEQIQDQQKDVMEAKRVQQWSDSSSDEEYDEHDELV